MAESRGRLNYEQWLSALEQIAEQVREKIGPLLWTDAGRGVVGTIGAGGDQTLEIDRWAEDIVLAELNGIAQRGERFSVLSEEIGLVDRGAEYPRVVVDPIDGSPNAARGLRMVGVMLSMLTGPTLEDVVIGTTVDMTSGERWSARRGVGVWRNGGALVPLRRVKSKIEVLGLHALPADLARAWPLLAGVDTFRQLYCMSISLAYTAAGGIDVFCSPRRARIFDLTCGLLLIREIGGCVTDLEGAPIDHLQIDLDTRTTLLCSADPGLHRIALDFTREVAAGGSQAVLGG